MADCKVSILGTVGLPANYGGFETLVENLVRYHYDERLGGKLVVYCSSKSYPIQEGKFLSAKLKYVPLNANGVQSIIYDAWSLLSAIWHRSDVILLLGVSGAIALPIVRLLSSARIVTNIDGIEWRREKWSRLAKHFLRLSEKIAVHFSHEIIADNAAIAEYIRANYGESAHVIPYGGDHAVAIAPALIVEYSLPVSYAFSVCRIEPENNVHMLLEAFCGQESLALVVVGNWDNSEYGRALRAKYSYCSHLFLLDPIYDLGKLKTLRSGATSYVHGHSAGGTNPSLVEAMHFGKPVYAYDCDFNRSTTEGKAFFFGSSELLAGLIKNSDMFEAARVGADMLEIARRRYTWRIVAQQYFRLLGIAAPAQIV